MRYMLGLGVLMTACLPLVGQQLTGTTDTLSMDFGFPNLRANDDLVFIDGNENGQIDPEEACAIVFTLINDSRYPAQDVLIKPAELNALYGLALPPKINLGTLAPGASRRVEVGIIARDSLQTGTANFAFAIYEGEEAEQTSGTIGFSIPVNEEIKEEEEDDSE